MSRQKRATISFLHQGECVRIKAKNTGGKWYKEKFDGRTILYDICMIGPPPHANLSITRGGRSYVGRKGSSAYNAPAKPGMLVCSAKGLDSTCITTKHVNLFPGGSGAARKWGVKVIKAT